ncbi:hypothetical protein [Gynuella sunshinyii]|uniref:Uncharacterized protein n=1 Tax=Gynuella sunshinyii YC6258 TaxID=1445510 RepID=A0A0C5VND2_9GAMM|nr:hypothetical protein [Gynuella sunshinyii]AJQ92252.1 hypothetical Protein YC6258_00200 [Gynuella sunshinyii YC6258]AJQ95801.1 hypothetical Protein YC6258_03765 [Gynuella sunshinyii YC6258]
MSIDIFQILGAGGNLSMIGVLLLFWRIDKRVTKLEWVIERWQERQG